MMPGLLRVDEYPTHRIGALSYCIGHTFPFGQLRKTLFSQALPRKETLFYRVFRSKVCGKARFFEVRIRGSDDLYGRRAPAASVNFVTCHDGFTLYDLVSYNEKHNLDNGEDNRDGSNDNMSWNCGAEGETDDPEINALRLRQMKNMLTVLLTSRGIPMLLSGDEFANTQYGNNNAYCQDNAVSWLDWTGLEKHRELYDYVRRLIAFRRAHPVLRANHYDFAHNGGTDRRALTRCGFASNLLLIGFHQPAYSTA